VLVAVLFSKGNINKGSYKLFARVTLSISLRWLHGNFKLGAGFATEKTKVRSVVFSIISLLKHQFEYI